MTEAVSYFFLNELGFQLQIALCSASGQIFGDFYAEMNVLGRGDE